MQHEIHISDAGKMDVELWERFQARLRSMPPVCTVSECASEVGLCPDALNRLCKQCQGCSAKTLIDRRRYERAQEQLRNIRLSIKAISIELRFSAPAHFTRFFLRMSGCTPQAYRKGLRGGRPMEPDKPAR